MIHLDYLADHPELIPIVAAWHQAQWSYLDASRTVEMRIARLQTHLQPNQIPTTFIAFCDDQLVGCASLVIHDMSARADLSPWLASVYVRPDYRSQGIGSALVRRVETEARRLGVGTLYLYTPDREAFYAQLGWTLLEHRMYRSYMMAVMQTNLGAGDPD